jgi:transcriptional regulator with XRE-family HTH domain
MREHGLSTRGLAVKLSISQQAINQWLSAQNGPSNRRLAQVANFFGVNVHHLLLPPIIEPEPKAEGSGKASDTVPIKQVEAKLAASGLELELPALDEDTKEVVLWDVPSTALADESSKLENIVVMRVGENALAPNVCAGDYIFADTACRAVFTPGVYLVLLAGLPVWRRCHPLLGDKVLVADRELKQEVSVGDLVVRGRAVRVLTQP